MHNLDQFTGLLVGIIGWAATASLLLNSPHVTAGSQRVMLVFTWLVWTVPAFDALVYRGFMAAETAMRTGATLTLLLSLVVLLPVASRKNNS